MNTTQHNVNIYTRDGSHVLGFTDVKAEASSVFTRNHNRVTSTIDAVGDIVGTSIRIDFDYIRAPIVRRPLSNLYVPNGMIGTLDLETYLVDGISKVYSIGFYR